VIAPDPRFYDTLGPTTLGALAELVGGQCPPEAAGRPVRAVSVLAGGGPDTISFLTGKRYAADAAATAAGACFVTPGSEGLLPPSCTPLPHFTPQAAWSLAAAHLHRPRLFDPHAPAIHPDAELEEGVILAPGVFVGAGAQIGAGTVLSPGAVIGPGVAIGRNGYVGPHASIGFALIGDNVRIQACAVIGEPGFGVTISMKGLLDVPQLGRVILQDGVGVGSATCIDRGAFEDTVIGENTKIDNLVQIAHNVRIGRNCVMAAHTGISGSVVIGDGAMLGGRVGISDHITIGSGVKLAANAAVIRDVPDGESWGGFPALPAARWMREVAWLSRNASGRRRREKG
jgi:UDP-3-O-[3-hydroxymyristoyl] glucosamine N-acyltransferase